MSLLVAQSASTVESHGTAANLNNLATGTFVQWVRPTNVNNVAHDLASKATGTPNGWEIFRRGVDGSSLRFSFYNSTGPTLLDVVSTTGALASGVWTFVAVTWDTASSANSKIYKGTLAAIVADVTSTSQSPSGAVGDDSSATLKLFNNTAFNGSLPGDYAVTLLFNRVLSLGEIKSLQFKPRSLSGCVLFVEHGFNGTGTQADWSGLKNNGTISGTAPTVTAHVPLSPIFGVDIPIGGGQGFRMEDDSYQVIRTALVEPIITVW